MNLKKLVVVVLAGAVCLPALAFSASATTAPAQVGDVNLDWETNVKDVTHLQRYLAGLAELDEEQEMTADFDRNGTLNIDDATWIQKYLAEMDIPAGYGGWLRTDVTIGGFYANYDSGKAVPYKAITFTAVSESGSTYAFYVDDLLVQARSSRNTMTYLFDASGEYDIKVKVYNSDGFSRVSSLFYEVVDFYDYNALSLTAFHMIDSYMFGMQASGGAAPYTYCIKLYGAQDRDTKRGLTQMELDRFYEYCYYRGDDGWQVCYDEYGAYLYHEFYDENTLYIDPSMLGDIWCMSEVQVYDSLGACTDPEDIVIYIGHPAPA